MPWLAAGLVGSSVIGGVLGAISNSSANDRAQMLQQQGIQQWLKTNIPDPKLQQLALQKFVVEGTLTPEMESAIKADPSAWTKVTQDQSLKQSQLRSLRSLEDLGTGKETFNDQAAEQNAVINSNAAARGHQKAIESSLAQRGQLGTGLELAARTGQAQADADTAGKQALQLESGRRANALKAIEGAGSLAGQMSDQDYKMQADKARAADAINEFNTQNLRDVNATNTKAKNASNLYNLQNAQDISNKNTAQSNYEQQYNKQLPQQQFEDQAKVAAGVSGQYDKAADQSIASGKNAANFYGNLAGNAPKVISAAADAFGSKKGSGDNMSQDEEDFWEGF